MHFVVSTILSRNSRDLKWYGAYLSKIKQHTNAKWVLGNIRDLSVWLTSSRWYTRLLLDNPTRWQCMSHGKDEPKWLAKANNFRRYNAISKCFYTIHAQGKEGLESLTMANYWQEAMRAQKDPTRCNECSGKEGTGATN